MFWASDAVLQAEGKKLGVMCVVDEFLVVPDGSMKYVIGVRGMLECA